MELTDQQLLAIFREAVVAERRRQWGLSGTVDTEDGATLAGLRAVIEASSSPETETLPEDLGALGNPMLVTQWMKREHIANHGEAPGEWFDIAFPPTHLPAYEAGQHLGYINIRYGEAGLDRAALVRDNPQPAALIRAINDAIGASA